MLIIVGCKGKHKFLYSNNFAAVFSHNSSKFTPRRRQMMPKWRKARSTPSSSTVAVT